MQGIGLAIDLANAGATVYRATEAFDFGGRHYDTGAGLVDGASISLADLAPKALKRDTPVYGLPRFVAPRKAVAKPKIAMWTGGTTTVPNPEYGTHCTSASDYCWARFTLEQKDGIPRAQLVGLTTTQITAGELTNPANGYTAFIVPQQYSVAANNAIAPIVQQFVNTGGRFLSYYTGGTTSARNIGLTALNTQTLSPAITTPGSTYDGTFDTTNPVAWGFDKGGFIYRDASGNAVYNMSTLTGNGGIDPGRVGAGDLQGRRQVLRLRGQLGRPRPAGRPRGGRRPAVRRRSRIPVRVGPVLPGLARVGRAPGAQRADLPAGCSRSPPRRPRLRRRLQPRRRPSTRRRWSRSRRRSPRRSCRRSRAVRWPRPRHRQRHPHHGAFVRRQGAAQGRQPREAAQEAPEASDLPGHTRQVHARHPRRARPRGRPRSEQVGVADHAPPAQRYKVRPLFAQL